MTAADLVIEELAAREAALLDANRQMADLLADLAVENAHLRTLWERDHLASVHGAAMIRRLQRQRQERRAA